MYSSTDVLAVYLCKMPYYEELNSLRGNMIKFKETKGNIKLFYLMKYINQSMFV